MNHIKSILKHYRNKNQSLNISKAINSKISKPIKMTNLAKLEFEALSISSENYLPWILDVDIHLDSMALTTQSSMAITRLLMNVSGL